MLPSYTGLMPTPDDIIAVARIAKDARRALEPVLKPLEGEVRGELGMGEIARLSTMLLTYNLDKSLSTESAAKNYIAMQNIMIAAAQRATKLPDLANILPPEVKDPRVAAVLADLKADALLKALGLGGAAPTTFGSTEISFDD